MKEKSKKTTIQSLHRLEKVLASEVRQFLVLMEEGSIDQMDNAKIKTKNALLKYGPDLQKCAEDVGHGFPEKVEKFLKSIDGIVHSAQGWVDEAQVLNCFQTTESLEKEIKRAA